MGVAPDPSRARGELERAVSGPRRRRVSGDPRFFGARRSRSDHPFSQAPADPSAGLLSVTTWNAGANTAPCSQRRKHPLKWVTWEQVGVDRMACAWLITTYLDPTAEFLFVPVGTSVFP